MRFSIQERIAIVEAYVRTGSFKETRSIFAAKFPNTSLPAKSSIQNLVKKWRTTGSVLNLKRQKSIPLKKLEMREEIKKIIIANPDNSVRKLSQQTGIKYTSCRRIVQSIKNEKEI